MYVMFNRFLATHSRKRSLIRGIYFNKYCKVCFNSTTQSYLASLVKKDHR